MNLQKIEPYLGIAVIGTGILCLIQAYFHRASLPILWLQLFLAVGGLWTVIYVIKVFLAYRNKELFFTTTLKWWNNIFYFGIAGFLLYLNFQSDFSSFTNLRSVVAFAFFLLSIATVKNYINLSDDAQIELSYQSVVVNWDDILKFERTPNGYGIFTQNDGNHAILFENIMKGQVSDFQKTFDSKIKNFDNFSELQHLVDD
ncbi:MAG: hypothetical protein AB8G11_13785 [Saprospiraceae bacterium]